MIKTIATFWLILIILFPTWFAQTDNQAQLYLQNVPIQDEKLLVVSLMMSHVVDLYGAEVQIRYDPNQLRARDENPRLEGIQIAPGPLLAFDERFVATNNTEPETGLINFVFTLIKPAAPISGEGALATVVFEVVSNGPFVIEIVNVKLVSSKLEAVPVTTTDLHLNDPQDTVSVPFAQNRLTLPNWGWWGLIALGGLSLVLLLILLRPNWRSRTTAARAPATPRRMPGATRTSPRSAALLAEQGQQALKDGSSQRAYELFSRAIELDPANAAAWLGKGLVAQQETEKRICFQRVLALDPKNNLARTELQKLESYFGNLRQNS
jgi:hypothetical protein